VTFSPLARFRRRPRGAHLAISAASFAATSFLDAFSCLSTSFRSATRFFSSSYDVIATVPCARRRVLMGAREVSTVHTVGSFSFGELSASERFISFR